MNTIPNTADEVRKNTFSYGYSLYVDDVRLPPPNTDSTKWILATTWHQAVYFLDTYRYDTVSLDHDLGCFYGNVEMTGRHIVGWLIQRKANELYVPPSVLVHSANSVGANVMREDIE
jgi:hypothetical protein